MIGIEDDTIICSGTIIIEPKIIRGGKSAAHIEDIVVLEKWRNKGIARELLHHLRNIANENDCYTPFDISNADPLGSTSLNVIR